MHATAALLPPDERRALPRAGVPLNRATLAAVAALARQARVRLARVGAPLGRRLLGDDYREITWTSTRPRTITVSRRRGSSADSILLQRLLAEGSLEPGRCPHRRRPSQRAGRESPHGAARYAAAGRGGPAARHATAGQQMEQDLAESPRRLSVAAGNRRQITDNRPLLGSISCAKRRKLLSKCYRSAEALPYAT